MKPAALKTFLDTKVDQFNNPTFIEQDPISIPHKYSKKQDIEITGFWTAMLSWGQRKTIINKSNELFSAMGDSPHEFILNHKAKDRKRLGAFKHRTFLQPDCYYFLEFFQWYYRNHNTLETAFFEKHKDVKLGIIDFREIFFSLTKDKIRTEKHVSSPLKGSTCKRINMFLRWMVRSDNRGVDFGIWKSISPSQLYCPLDVHVSRVAKSFGLLKRKQNDWRAVEELTTALAKMDSKDPVKYDYALFSLGVLEKR